MRAFLPALVIVSSAPGAGPAAAADLELSFYTGVQSAPHSGVTGNDPALGELDFRAGWEGKPFEAPPYYGVRAMWWQPSGWGFGVEVNHAKVYADDETRAENGFERLQFSDGLNLVTANVMRRWKTDSRWTPYVGGGLGFSVPYVHVTTAAGSTTGYQFGGVAVILVAGAAYSLNDRWDVFGEYKGSFSSNSIDLDNGGELQTDIVTNALNIGVTYKF